MDERDTHDGALDPAKQDSCSSADGNRGESKAVLSRVELVGPAVGAINQAHHHGRVPRVTYATLRKRFADARQRREWGRQIPRCATCRQRLALQGGK